MASSINASTTAGVVTTADTSGVLNLQTAGTTAVTVDASQRVGIGTASPATKLNISSAGADVEVRASTTTSGNVRFGFDADGAYYNWIQTNRSSGAIQFAISNSEVVQINSVGGLKVLNTIGVGNTTPSTSGAGITFPASQSASTNANTLDDYEEGTWTPAGLLGSAGTSSTSSVVATYTKVGRLVSVACSFNFTLGTGSGNFSVTGLPFAANSALVYTAISTGCENIGTSTKNIVGYVNPSNTNIILIFQPQGTGASVIVTSGEMAATSTIRISATYFSA